MAPQALDLQAQPSLSITEGSVESDSLEDDNVEILVELVGACHLKPDHDDDVEDMAQIQPFCKVKLGERVVHQTKTAEQNGPSPIWTVKSRSLFLIGANSKDIIHHGLHVSVWTQRKSILKTGNVFLGQIHMDVSTIIARCDEERFELDLVDEAGEEAGLRGSLALRMRMATPGDVRFVRARNQTLERQMSRKERMQRAVSSVSKTSILQGLLDKEEETASHTLATLVTEQNEKEIVGASFANALSSVFSVKSFLLERSTGSKKVRVKPSPDPKRSTTTTYMAPDDIKLEALLPSQNWVDAGSGTLGTLHLEILSCHDLPNMDVGEAVGNLTDSFVCAVFEDTVVQTPVIDDELSPHWLPWTQRAFRIAMMHPASVLYLAVFDYDLGISAHQPIGRVAVNISNLQRDTVYNLRYSLYPSSNVTDRTAQGVISIRLRVEMADEKAALMAALKPRPRIYVNVQRDKTFHVVRYTCFGEYNNEEKFDMTVFRSYINEIFEYKRNLSYCIGDAFRSLMFWRGQVEVFSVFLPLHSALFFYAGTTLIDRPHMFPSFFLLGIAWIMLATMRHRLQHPSPWYRCPTFLHYFRVLWTGHSPMSVKAIKSKQGWEEAQAYEDAQRKRLEEDQKVALERAAMLLEIQNIGDDTIDTKVPDGISIALLATLAWYQGLVGRICRFFRLVKIIITWEESIVSFWITATFLGVGLVSLLLPWVFILTWTARIVIWGFFGPHMKLVDLALKSKSSDKNAVQQVLANFQQMSRAARLRREEALKLKAVKCLRFGRYITQVPAFNLARHYDRPLPESTARIYRKGSLSPAVNSSFRLPGQQLHGVMIPRPEKAFEANREISFRQRNRLTKLEARIVALKAAAAFGGGLQMMRKRMLQLQTINEPVAAGHEVVPCSEISVPSTRAVMEVVPFQIPLLACENCPGTNLCIMPYQEEDVQDRPPSSVQVLMTDVSAQVASVMGRVNEFQTSFMVKEATDNWTHFPYEEGVEVIASGRLSSIGTDEYEEEEPYWAEDLKSVGSLSIPNKATETTFVTFYRP